MSEDIKNRHGTRASGGIHPRGILTELGLSVVRAADILDVRRATLSKYKQCRYQRSLRSGTMMEHSRLALRGWYLAIYLVT